VSDAQQSVVIEANHSCFKLFGAYGTEESLDSWSSTLVENLNHTDGVEADFIIKTGSQFGPFAVQLRVLQTSPPDPAERWEDVVEVSLTLGPEIGVGELIDGPEVWSHVDPGPHRLRVSARGRTESAEREQTFHDDDLDDDVQDEALEHYLLELWPAAVTPPTCIRENSQFAHDTIDPPAPQWPVEREAGLIAARAVAADLRKVPGARSVSGQLGEVRVSMEVMDTPTRMFNRVKYANGWPPSNGGGISLNERIGDIAFHYADPPDSDGLAPLLGTIETEVIELAKPKRFAMRWNWRIAGSDGAPYPTNPRLLETDSTVTMTFAKISAAGQDTRTLIAVHHAGIPIEWVADLESLWLWDLAVASRQ
jgi:hypothetical protein